MPRLSCVVIGNESLLVQCSEILLLNGIEIRAVVTRNDDIRNWATQNGLTVLATGRDLAARLDGGTFDWLLSIANLDIIPQDVLAKAAKGAINFHDGPLPRYAGLNAPVWALMNREPQHGITWHLIAEGVDKGDILESRTFEISPEDTALTLNTKCFEAAIESFGAVADALAADTLNPTPQDFSKRSYYARNARPKAAARLDFNLAADDLVAFVRSLDHGDYWNPLFCPKIEAGGRVFLVSAAHQAEQVPLAAPGTVLAIDDGSLTVATGSDPIVLSGIGDCFGKSVDPATVAKVGDVLPSLGSSDADALTSAMEQTLAAEDHWRARLAAMVPVVLPLATPSASKPDPVTRDLSIPAGANANDALVAMAALTARLAGKSSAGFAWHNAGNAGWTAGGYIADWVPVGIDATLPFNAAKDAFLIELEQAGALPGFASDLLARSPNLRAVSLTQVGLSRDPKAGLIAGTCLTLAVSDQGAVLFSDATTISDVVVDLMVARLEHLIAEIAADAVPDIPLTELPVMTEAERKNVLYEWNKTQTEYDKEICVHQMFEAQVARTPDAIAVVFEGESLTYSELNQRANQVAHVLRDMGVGPGSLVGLHAQRSTAVLIGALAIQKAGGAYVPLDPAYPADRIALYIKDSAAKVIITQSQQRSALPDHAALVLEIDADPRIDTAPTDNPQSGVTSSDLAYLIYTSGSTGKPKGVMVEHRNVSNFFSGMDERISHDPPGVWLAVTSLSFDISVLELFYTLARGFKIVFSGDESRALVSSGRVPTSQQGMEFSLFYWGNDDGIGPKKYELLLEGAKFADRNGFCAVWTPERHFHAFGGPYPNPSVTGAAVAAVTKNLAVRAGSCVAPLHHTARIAEEWAVIDNLTNGRAGLAIASGWQPDDFVLRPENTPPNNKPAMLEAITTLRKLWAGESVEFAKQSGEMFGVVTQPRPVSKTLPIWVTTAGNPETWKEAGAIGANVLTHLLGQTVDEVEGKIKLYHAALRDAGHNPADHKVTLMLHTFVGQDRDDVREIAREPMKDYLRSAAGLIKQYAWAFPAFKKPVGVSNPFELDLGSLNDEELEAILDFAFQRYFDDSGLFGTVNDCLARVEQIKQIGVDEVACLIDYGIPVPQVMEGLTYLAEVLKQSNTTNEIDPEDFSIAAQIVRHGITHLQCTPSMARMITMNDDARHALARVSHLMIGGEALPGSLVAEFAKITNAAVENMYGPTETTIWSTTETAGPDEAVVNIGRPIANTQVYVLDENRDPLPVGVPGELYIGGHGVTRGYWQRPDLTADRFVEDPFVSGADTAPGGARMYRTGDLVRWRADGKMDFLGREDHQIKLRGYRIELGEIEAVIEAVSGVRQAVVVAREDTPGLTQLVAYITTDTSVQDQKLRTHLADQLPEFMVPSHIVQMDALPLTPNKKVDRNALPIPDVRQSSQPDSGFVEPENSAEKQIAAIWSRILGVQNIGAKDHFFSLGGHSLLAVQAHREIRETMGAAHLSITDIFRFPTLAALAAKVANVPGGQSNAPSEAAPVRAERAAARSDAMSRRKEMRARRSGKPS